jgi:hypothetical protein
MPHLPAQHLPHRAQQAIFPDLLHRARGPIVQPHHPGGKLRQIYRRADAVGVDQLRWSN